MSKLTTEQTIEIQEMLEFAASQAVAQAEQYEQENTAKAASDVSNEPYDIHVHIRKLAKEVIMNTLSGPGPIEQSTSQTLLNLAALANHDFK